MVVCRHDPIWPQPGDTVRINMAVIERPEIDGPSPWFPVNRTEIWFNDPTMPVEVVYFYGTSSASFESEVLEAGSFTYGCRAVSSGNSIFSGWRGVAVGSPPGVGPIPIAHTGPTTHRLDLVFVADEDSYDDPMDPDFLEDVQDIVEQSMYGFGYYNRFQHLFNFWISRNTGGADRENPPDQDPIKTIIKPVDWEQNYAFANAAAVLHEDNFRDFAKGRFFTTWTGLTDSNRFRVLRHELGHSMFGLSDEYCCNTTHFESSVLPNVFKELEDCEADAPDLGRPPEDCRSMTSEVNNKTHYTSEPEQPDLMRNNTIPRQADIRKIEWKFDRCWDGKC